MISEHIILHLSLIEGVGPLTVQQIVSSMPESFALQNLYLLSAVEWQRLFGCSSQLAQKIVEGLQSKQALETELRLLEHHSINWTTMLSDDYPQLLSTIHSPPAVLYWQGAYPAFEHAVAFVGSRAATEYGARAVKLLIPELVLADCAIISGGALGIDAISHQAALDAGGKTVAVVGSGLLQPQLVSNRKLFDDIVYHGGSMVSIFPLSMGALPGHFPARNRIIAGLSHGTVVVQAAKKSGALITAHYALEQGREVFAVPGALDDPYAIGCHALIQQGAKLVITASDILTEFGWMRAEPLYDAAAQLSVLSLSSKKRQPSVPADSIQARVLNLCVRPSSIDELATQLDMQLFAAQTLLFDMQLEGLVEQDFAGLWRARR